MILLSGAIFCAGHFVEMRESMQTNNKMAVAPVGKLICMERRPTARFAELNGRDAERAATPCL